jgi:pimeloyl-ACP methyl ester carboxylesterase
VEAGIDLRRIRLMPQLDGRDVVKNLLGICDLGLDSFPYPGVTTVVDAIDARLPTIALRGRTLRANQGAEILDSIGLGELIAPDVDAYCQLAISYANDPQRRLDARARLDAAMLSPPMALDPDRFATATATVLAGLVAEMRKTAPMPGATRAPSSVTPPRHADIGKLETIMLSRPDGTRICVHRMRAPGPDLLLLGGYGRSSPLRKPIGATVLAFCKANRLGLAALEFRGQGGSSGALQRQTPADMRDDVLAVCRELGLCRTIGLGASLGGWVMMAAQATEPTLLRGALLLAPAIDWDRHFLLPAISVGRGIVQPDGDVAFPSDSLLLGGSFMTGIEALRLPAGDIGMTGPLRILHGGHDRIVPLATSAEFVARHGAHLPMNLRVLPAEGHGLSAGDTAQSATAIGEELAALIAACGAGSEA